MPPTREADLDGLMAGLARGDRSAFAPLYEALRPRAQRLVAMRLGPAAAQDVAQAALMNLFAHASDFEPGRPCLPWFYAIVANEIRAARRSDARVVVSDGDAFAELSDDADADAEAQLLARELARAVEVAIDSLDVESANAIHALLGRAPLPPIPAATFRKRVSRAYSKLRLLLGGNDAS